MRFGVVLFFLFALLGMGEYLDLHDSFVAKIFFDYAIYAFFVSLCVALIQDFSSIEGQNFDINFRDKSEK